MQSTYTQTLFVSSPGLFPYQPLLTPCSIVGSANPTVAGLGQCVEEISPGSGFYSYNIRC